ncbi:PTS sugar transporter subunit IIA [Amedibacillus sp. YH-ame10]
MQDILNGKNIVLNARIQDMSEAIQKSGEVLLNNGYITPEYIDDMLKKEEICPSYIGMNIAIPHGFSHSETMIKRSGVSFIQVPQGFQTSRGETVYLVFGIAGNNDEHINVLGKIALICSEDENVERLKNAKTTEEVFNILNLNDE